MFSIILAFILPNLIQSETLCEIYNKRLADHQDNKKLELVTLNLAIENCDWKTRKCGTELGKIEQIEIGLKVNKPRKCQTLKKTYWDSQKFVECVKKRTDAIIKRHDMDSSYNCEKYNPYLAEFQVDSIPCHQRNEHLKLDKKDARENLETMKVQRDKCIKEQTSVHECLKIELKTIRMQENLEKPFETCF